jgi:cytochrome c553
MKYLTINLSAALVGFVAAISNANAIPQTGEIFYNDFGCGSCHGKHATGKSEAGPSLVGKDINTLVEHMISARLGYIENSSMEGMSELEGKEETIAIWLAIIAKVDEQTNTINDVIIKSPANDSRTDDIIIPTNHKKPCTNKQAEMLYDEFVESSNNLKLLDAAGEVLTDKIIENKRKNDLPWYNFWDDISLLASKRPDFDLSGLKFW